LKYINLIIITINLNKNDCQDLKKLVDTAKSEKMLSVGYSFSDCMFENIHDAYAKTKELIVSGNYIRVYRIRNKFKLY